MANDAATTAAPVNFERMQTQATESVRRDARRVHELVGRFRELYRARLEEWVQLRARLDRRGATLHPVGIDTLRAEHEQLGRELAMIQARLKRLEVTGRQLDALATYLGATEAPADEPSLSGTDDSVPISLRIVAAQEGERQRLAEDVHDGPAQVLTNAIFEVDYLDRMLSGTDAGAARAEVSFLRDMLRDGLDEVRNFIADLRPPVVDIGLAAAIGEQAASLEKRHGISVHTNLGGIDQRLTPEARASVLRIVQEALQNVRKHAAASEVVIGLEGDRLVIADNGRGFDVMRLASGASHFGLQFMRERAELMGGQLQIESRQGEGTRILLRLPRTEA